MKSKIHVITILVILIQPERFIYLEAIDCPLLRGCKAIGYPVIDCFDCLQVTSTYSVPGFECHAERNLGPNLDTSSWNGNQTVMNSCVIYNYTMNSLHMKFPRTQNHILGKNFNFSDYFSFVILYTGQHNLRFSNLKGFQLDSDIRSAYDWRMLDPYWVGLFFDLIFVRFNFYSGSKLIKSCADIDENKTMIDSFFQIPHLEKLSIKICHFPRPLCPLVFKNVKIYLLRIVGWIDNFYKRNFLRFTPLLNELQEKQLNSRIYDMDIIRVENVFFDSTVLPPVVYKDLKTLKIYGSVRGFEESLLKHFPKLALFRLELPYYRKIVHAQGIAWIRSYNFNLTIDPNNLTQVSDNRDKLKLLAVSFEPYIYLADGFPDSDFCLYAKFPFEQLVVLRFDFVGVHFESLIEPFSYDPDDKQIRFRQSTCLFHWLSKYFYVLKSASNSSYLSYLKPKFDKIKTECDFERRLQVCNKTQFKPERMGWDKHDWKKLVNIVLLLIDVSIHPISLFGILTNSIIIYMIVSKKNDDIFKGFRQYTYLAAISVFNIAIQVIQIISWIGQCSQTIDLFCPITRKFVAVQFFRIIFKEFFIVHLRFMCNFSYVAFALNRISLIGQNHTKLVEFMTRVNIRNFFIVTTIISALFSLVKGFQLKVNYGRSDELYPTSFEQDFRMRPFDSAIGTLFIANFISDFLNYFFFLGFNLGIDVYMLVRLRNTLNEKVNRFADKTTSTTKSPKSKKENISKEQVAQKTMKNAIKMVVFNSTLNITLKFTFLITPLINVISVFYYKSKTFRLLHDYSLDSTYRWLQNAGFFFLFQNLSEWLFTLLIATQLFFYIRFDKKIKSAWSRFLSILKHKRDSSIKPAE